MPSRRKSSATGGEGSDDDEAKYDDHFKAVAARQYIGYQTLLKQFVTERLYEEEKREGLV